jgi:hypothetical protein
MHVRAPHGRVAFGLGILRAAGPAGSAVVSPTTSTAASLLEEEAAAGGGGCCCCWRRRLRARQRFAIDGGGAPQGLSLPVCCRGGSRLVGAWSSRRWTRSESVGPGLGASRGWTAGLYIYTYSQCAVSGPEPAEADPTGSVFLRATTRLSKTHYDRARRG